VVRTAFKSVFAHKVRLLLTGVAIVLGVSLVAGTFIFTDTINAQFDSLLGEIYEGTDVSVRSAGGDFSAATEPFPASVYDDIIAVDGVMAADGGVSSVSAQVLDSDGNPIGGQGPPTLGFSWGDTEALNPIKIQDGNGRPPAGPGEIAIDLNSARNANLELGDMVTVVAFNGPEDFVLVGLTSFGDADSLLGATLISFELEEARSVFGYGDELTGIVVQAEAGVDAADLTAAIAEVLPEGVEAVTGETEQNEQAAEISEGLSFLSVGLLAFAGVSIFVGGFIIQNTFRIIIAQRTRELALLRALGATGRQVRSMVIIEALIVGVVGSVVGIAFGFLLALGIRALMNAVGLGLTQSGMVLLPRTVVIGMTVGVLLTVASSLLPARKASRIPPIAALREDASRTPRRSLHKRAVVGAAVTGTGVALLAIGLFLGVSNPLLYVALGAAIGFIGVSILAPLAARPLADIIGWPMPKLFGVSGQLAKENTKRQPRRTASTASALMVGVALVVFFSVFASSTKASVSETVFELFPADITFQSTNQTDPEVPAVISPEFADDLRMHEELEVVSAMQFGKAVVGGDEKLIAAVDPATIDQVFSLGASDGVVAALVEPETIIVSTSYLEDSGHDVGDTLTIEYLTTGTVDTTIVGVFEANDFSDFAISTDTYVANFRYEGDAVIFANTAEGVSVDEAQDAVAPTVASYGNVKAQTKSDIVTEAENQIDQALVLFTGLLLFAVIIAILGITNTLTLSVYERTQEIGLLRAVGMTRRQVRRMVRWEAVIVATFGALLGVGIGIVLGWAVVKALADEGLGAFSIPVGQVILALILAAGAGVLAAIWPARKAARMNILDAISTE